jgi:hypothetical protein
MMPPSAIPTSNTMPAGMPPAAPAFGAVPPSAPAVASRATPLLRVVSAQQLNQQEADRAKAAEEKASDPAMSQLASHVRGRLTEMRNFRNSEGIGEKLIEALRTFRGQYSPGKLQEIKRFQGSEVYARITSTKCRGATALLRDIFLGSERPWAIEPTPVPEIPDNIAQSIQQLVSVEVTTMQQAGQQIDSQQIADRVNMLKQAAVRAAKAKALQEADKATDKLDDVLIEGGFYEAFAEFLIDLPIFPFAVLKGPVVRKKQQLKWVNGKPEMQSVPKMTWNRVSPFDLYWSPGAATMMEAEFVERIRLSRSDLVALKGLPGYDNEAIDQVLTRFGDVGFRDWFDAIDQERARMEDRSNWPRTSAQLLDTAEFNGTVQGSTLIDWGMTTEEIPDALAEYRVTCWLIDRYIIKTQLSVTPKQRSPYYISNYEKVPGSLVGSALPDLLEDVQSIGNATARALVNNMSISSGPQVVINDHLLAPGESDDMYPWKRWHMNWDPMITGTLKPIDFFQPQSNAEVLMAVYEKFNGMADEISSLPRYMLGNEKVGGAGRTASGLAMLMGNASKTLQNVAASIDRDIMEPVLQELYDLVMITSPGEFRGDEIIAVKGVNHAAKREQERLRQLEFLQITANPIDMQIIGPRGRATVLRSVSENLGLETSRVVPDDQELQAQQQAMQMQQAAGGGQPGQPALPAPGASPGERPQPTRAGPEAAREPIEGQMSNNATGRPGMRAGG